MTIKAKEDRNTPHDNNFKYGPGDLYEAVDFERNAKPCISDCYICIKKEGKKDKERGFITFKTENNTSKQSIGLSFLLVEDIKLNFSISIKSKYLILWECENKRYQYVFSSIVESTYVECCRELLMHQAQMLEDGNDKAYKTNQGKGGVILEQIKVVVLIFKKICAEHERLNRLWFLHDSKECNRIYMESVKSFTLSSNSKRFESKSLNSTIYIKRDTINKPATLILNDTSSYEEYTLIDAEIDPNMIYEFEKGRLFSWWSVSSRTHIWQVEFKNNSELDEFKSVFKHCLCLAIKDQGDDFFKTDLDAWEYTQGCVDIFCDDGDSTENVCSENVYSTDEESSDSSSVRLEKGGKFIQMCKDSQIMIIYESKYLIFGVGKELNLLKESIELKDKRGMVINIEKGITSMEDKHLIALDKTGKKFYIIDISKEKIINEFDSPRIERGLTKHFNSTSNPHIILVRRNNFIMLNPYISPICIKDEFCYHKNMNLSLGSTTKDGRLTTATEKNEVRVYDIIGEKAKFRARTCIGPNRALDVTEDGDYIVTTCNFFCWF